METARWQDLRQLFDAVCDQPPALWEQCLRTLSDDPVLIAEALDLLRAQTASFDRALEPLRELMASLPDAELQVGDRLGAWQLVERLGSGGMGTVFVAERADGLFRQRVAIKLLRGTAGRGATAGRLAAERQILAELQHPDIARLYDGGTTPAGEPYLVMEHVEGLPLDAYCEHAAPPLRQRLEMFVRICRAVQAAHQRLVVHCDLKPGNVLVRPGGDPVLLDFGIARLLDAETPGEAGSFCTPAYASPELLAGRPVSVVSDVFSLGVLLAELLACRRTGRGAADSGVLVSVPSALAGTGCRWRSKLAGDLDAIVARACALDPYRRYPSVEALAADIERHLQRRPVQARAPTLRYRAGRWLHRNWRGSAAAATVVAATGVFVWQLGMAQARAEREADTAQRVSDFLVATFDAADPRMRGASGTEEPTARRVLDLGAERVDAELAGSPAVLHRMQWVLGRAYANLGERERSEAMLRRAVEGFLAPDTFRPDLAAAALGHLATLMSNQMRAADAMEAARRALDLRLRHDSRPESLAVTYNALGLAQQTSADYAAAEVSYLQALALNRQLHGADSLEVAATLHNLAQMHRFAGDAAQAEAHYRQALEIKLVHGSDSVTVHASRQGLAMTLGSLGRFDEAASLLRENILLAEALVGRDSEKVADTEMKLAMVLQQSGEYDVARAHYLEALAITERVLGRDSIDYAVVAGQLATLEETRGDLEAAEPLYRVATEIRRARLPSGDRLVLRNEAYLGRVLWRLGRLQEGGALLANALPAWQRYFDGHTPGEPMPTDLVSARLIEADWLLRQGRLDEAEQVIPVVDEAQPGLVLARSAQVAELAQRRRDWGRASTEWQRVVALSAAHAGEDSPPTAKWRVSYAETLAAAGDAVAAGEQVRLAEASLRRVLVPGAELLQRLDAVRAQLAAADGG
ncbi:tetratricopeptide repeat protein [Luteimonas sp. R10]|uniref:tetratricopeptide repeat protein n=1 Tax=Luteimonas sp. R10 TaxID=3108176 RepID=UPI00308BB249|nr:serine/threonine-protein kinase [Luteimonas sp. R10]